MAPHEYLAKIQREADKYGWHKKLRAWVGPKDSVTRVLEQMPDTEGTTHTEYGVMHPVSKRIEWGASVGMTHRYEYTKDSVFGLAGENAVYRRTRTTYRDVVGEPEPITRQDLEE